MTRRSPITYGVILGVATALAGAMWVIIVAIVNTLVSAL